MEDERRRCQVVRRQARELVYKVYSYFKRESDAGMPVHDVAKAQERTAEACEKVLKVCKELLAKAKSQFLSLYISGATRLRS
jgi:hypothetical protein